MSGTPAFQNGNAVLVVTRGPGKMHLISYASNAKPAIVPHFGSMSTPAGTTERDETRFLITHSYTFEQCAFYWEGAGEAAYGVGNSLVRQAVGRSWQAAINVGWGATTATTTNVSGQLASGVQRDNLINCYIVPALT
ncbi:hypothetical protein DFH08DRAFT_133780 [Mycena albidolilacea]|uniref:Uncharacterized protein n=1 Tax=Mycena albidolilacea TaxID=1033008 RepID=A0AAD7A4S5_9AGAR|nr:hypothetical protein DFH08DRAFT_133780 [Mycena albidolilacea]